MAATLFDMDGQVAVVTGSSKGIGRAIAERMAQHGARVVISSRRQDACEAVAAGIRDAGGSAMAVACNIGRKEELQALVDRTIGAWGRIDTLVCNAAVNPYFGPSAGIPDDAWDRIMGTNIRSNHWLCTMVLPGMAARGSGSVIIVSSIAGLRGTATLGAYGVSKAADMQLTRNLAVEWGPYGIRANCIAPGLVRTDFARALWEDADNLARRTADTPLKADRRARRDRGGGGVPSGGFGAVHDGADDGHRWWGSGGAAAANLTVSAGSQGPPR